MSTRRRNPEAEDHRAASGRPARAALLSLLTLLAGLAGPGGCDGARIDSMKELSQGLHDYHKEAYVKARAHFQEAVEAD
ncbi:MAG: hypothetical protein FJ125_06970, partial [Deltaproteobacteria bacterium]|nr:hypothetical protein [Deltaproteobacteria bacterium]